MPAFSTSQGFPHQDAPWPSSRPLAFREGDTPSSNTDGDGEGGVDAHSLAVLVEATGELIATESFPATASHPAGSHI
jgi:hypothetical protein